MHEYLFGINQELCRLKRELPHLDILEVCRLGYMCIGNSTLISVNSSKKTYFLPVSWRASPTASALSYFLVYVTISHNAHMSYICHDQYML